MRENRTQGSARGLLGNGQFYLNRHKKMKYFTTIAIALFGAVPWSFAEPRVEVETLSRLFEAIANDDVDALKELWVPRLTKEFEEIGWEKVMEEYKRAWKTEGFDKFDLAKLTFDFKGDTEFDGNVELKYEGESKGRMRVRKVSERWLLNER